jgi:hypothetical protein
MSGRTYEKARAVVLASEQDPDLLGDLPAQMDSTGKVDPAYRELESRRAGQNGASATTRDEGQPGGIAVPVKVVRDGEVQPPKEIEVRMVREPVARETVQKMPAPEVVALVQNICMTLSAISDLDLKHLKAQLSRDHKSWLKSRMFEMAVEANSMYRRLDRNKS